MKKLKNVFVIALLAGLIGWGLLNAGEDNAIDTPVNSDLSDVEVGIEQGNLAPDFELETLEGEALRLSDFRGEKVILNLWATWCPPCRAEMPHMQDFYEKNKDQDMTILAVNLTTQERNTSAVEPFVYDEFQLTFPVVLDVDGDVGTMYQAYSIPTTYIIDTQGLIQNKVVGPMSYELMETLMDSID
ncbi:peroxiredoxin family protein [Desertibacillus haloalkaliphilus]|uniref:peroxiredoxin family protein n=1 Tax=Desertibacillus haloalkaliphilus TaxID=1328930 RepID=UPI001C265C6F|nr:redoxin domain-containing protein [Desertibacillus haloalkaliphilus]MBU8908716.1 redoxin domain-containing protein [Desertibacillus haloalkaliphilus]